MAHIEIWSTAFNRVDGIDRHNPLSHSLVVYLVIHPILALFENETKKQATHRMHDLIHSIFQTFGDRVFEHRSRFLFLSMSFGQESTEIDESTSDHNAENRIINQSIFQSFGS